jgi:type III pantothenate kinase
MTDSQAPGLIAVDIGNSRMKIGRFSHAHSATDAHANDELPQPDQTLSLAIDSAQGEFDAAALHAYCREHVASGTPWYVANVNRPAGDRFTAEVSSWAAESRLTYPIRQISFRDVPIAINVEEPSRVGIDRLLAAVAADRVRRRDHAAIVVDLGSAITVDLLNASGAFCGGAILPGIATSARALEEHTDALPLVAMDQLERPPAPVGKSTITAIESGLYWGAVGAVCELIGQMSRELPAEPDVFLTGGASAHVAELLQTRSSYPVRHMPNLVLSGITLVAS